MPPPEAEADKGAEGKESEAVDPVAAAKAENEALKQQLATSEAGRQQAEKVASDARGYVTNLINQVKAGQTTGNEAADSKGFQERFEEDPEAAINEAFNARVGPIYQEYLENQGKASREIARAKLENREEGDRWSDYEAEVDEFMAGMPPDVKARPDSYESAFNLVRLRHVDQIVEKKVKEKSDPQRRAQSEHASPAAPRKPALPSLNAEEKRIAGVLGISEADYLQSKIEHAEAGGQWQGSAGLISADKE
jgi:hypothetical protein